jgi:hypothetical protein
MGFVKGWKRTAAHIAIGVVVAVFAWFTLKSEASLSRRSVRLMQLDAVEASE